MFVFLNSTLQVLLKTPVFCNIFQLTNISMGTIASIYLFQLGSIWFIIYRCFNRVLYMYNISHITEEKVHVQVTCRNAMFCKFALHIFFLDNVGDTFSLIPSGKSPIFLVPN